VVLVYGDTNSTLAGALAAAKLNIPIVHIEAGLRSFNREMPEEVNRVLTDHLSKLLFAPTSSAIANLANEGIKEGVYRVGDVMCDSLNLMKPFLEKKLNESYYFVTLHRPYNTDEKDRLVYILGILNALSKKVVFPIHPRTQNNLKKWMIDLDTFDNILFIPPVGYEACLSYQTYSDYIITDSGGIQKEAYMLKKPCITIRKETEWVETLEGGCNMLVFEDLEQIRSILENDEVKAFKDLYGDGHAAEAIVAIIEEFVIGEKALAKA
jgi:UDP-GlcNAc3NAcA epimerase